jgi:hypothetical protein
MPQHHPVLKAGLLRRVDDSEDYATCQHCPPQYGYDTPGRSPGSRAGITLMNRLPAQGRSGVLIHLVSFTVAGAAPDLSMD